MSARNRHFEDERLETVNPWTLKTFTGLFKAI